jgi:pyrrolidone-carboxylate peptidase
MGLKGTQRKSSKMPKIWIYGFGPFRQYRKNITQEMLNHLPERTGVKTQVLPVRFERDLFLKPVESFKPDYILGLGQCPRGDLLRLERRAFNGMRDRRLGLEQPIDATQPEHILLSWKLPVRSDTRISYDAGRYVCNYSMFVLGRHAQERGIPSAFVHIPRTYALKSGLAWLEQLLKDLA